MIRYCKKCGRKLSKHCSGDFCNTHRDRSGKNNSFFGKRHDRQMIESTKIKLREISIKKWEDSEYRQRVINAVSKPRPDSFKVEQSERIKQWYIDNPGQRLIRKQKMIASWKNGKIKPNLKNPKSTSNVESKFYADVKNISADAVVKKSIRLGDGSWVIPDTLIQRLNTVIEFYGDYWHANPDIYFSDEIVHHKKTAQQIWDADETRRKKLIDAGYDVLIVWQSDYKNNKNVILEKMDAALNWDACSF